MFRIPAYFQMDMTWDDAVRTIKGRGNDNLLEGMEFMNKMWERHVNDQNAFYAGETDEMIYGDDTDFYDHWMYEVNAFNVVYEGMGKLFGEVK